MFFNITIKCPKETPSFTTTSAMLDDVTYVRNKIRNALKYPEKSIFKQYKYSDDYYLVGNTGIARYYQEIEIRLSMEILISKNLYEDFFNRLYTIGLRYAEKKGLKPIIFCACGTRNTDYISEDYKYISENNEEKSRFKKHQINYFDWYFSPLNIKIQSWLKNHEDIKFPLFYQDENDNKVQTLLQFLKLQTTQDLSELTDEYQRVMFYLQHHNLCLTKRLVVEDT